MLSKAHPRWVDPALPSVAEMPPVVDSDFPAVHYVGTEVTMTAHVAVRYKLTCTQCHFTKWSELGEDQREFETRSEAFIYDHTHFTERPRA